MQGTRQHSCFFPPNKRAFGKCDESIILLPPAADWIGINMRKCSPCLIPPSSTQRVEEWRWGRGGEGNAGSRRLEWLIGVNRRWWQSSATGGGIFYTLFCCFNPCIQPYLMKREILFDDTKLAGETKPAMPCGWLKPSANVFLSFTKPTLSGSVIEDNRRVASDL